MRTERPATPEEAAEALGAAAAEEASVRPRGGGTKLDWGAPRPDPHVEVATGGLARILEHNSADLTAVVESGLPLARAQEAFSEAGQMLALDPPVGSDDAATVGGIVAAADSGPLRHRYGAARDLLLGMTVALSDGTLARSGGKVIKNVAGYDLAKLFAGSHGTLGLIVEVAVRLHPIPARRVTAAGASEDPAAIQRASIALAHAPLELECLDVAWERGGGRVLARCGGAAAGEVAGEAARRLGDAGLEARVHEDDEDPWSAQRAGQRSAEGTVVKVSGLPSALARVLAAAERAGASVVGRAGLGLSWIRLEGLRTDKTAEAIADLRRALEPSRCVVQGAPAEVRERVDPWHADDGPAIDLMRRVKARFDPRGVCNPGVLAGGI